MAANNNLSVLTALDTARTQWYHVTTIVIAGMGFFTDAYDLFCISTISKLLGRLYYFDPASDAVNNAVIGMALAGTLTGQLTFGYLGDKLGRKKVYGVTLILMTICAIGSGLSFGSSVMSVMKYCYLFKQLFEVVFQRKLEHSWDRTKTVCVDETQCNSQFDNSLLWGASHALKGCKSLLDSIELHVDLLLQSLECKRLASITTGLRFVISAPPRSPLSDTPFRTYSIFSQSSDAFSRKRAVVFRVCSG
ncbi:unnamed protein product [Rhodiola kirilowii]